MKPLHCATPFVSMVGLADIALMDIPIIGGGIEDEVPMLQSTGGDLTVIGAMLKVAVAVNGTFPPGKFCASALDGVTIRFCITLPLFAMVLPPQPASAGRKQTAKEIMKLTDRVIQPPRFATRNIDSKASRAALTAGEGLFGMIFKLEAKNY
jgi:hypothetical protein